jgi:soluble lytic murein transglycosylase-like protein
MVLVDLLKIIQIESDNDPRARTHGWTVRPDGSLKEYDCRGLMQINVIDGALEEYNRAHPDEQFTSDDMYDPVKNVKVGDWYLHVRLPEMFKVWGIVVSIPNLIFAYNAGPTSLYHWIRRGSNPAAIPSETQRYLQKYFASSTLPS